MSVKRVKGRLPLLLRVAALAAALVAILATEAPAAANEEPLHASGPTLPATAVPPAPGAPEPKSELAVEASPIVGANPTWGWNGITVRVHNSGARPARGELAVEARTFGSDGHTFRATAPFNAPGAGVQVRVPVLVPLYCEVHVTVTHEGGPAIAPLRLNTAAPAGVTLFDASASASVVRGAINEAAIAPSYAMPYYTGRGSGPMLLAVHAVRTDPATGDPILPDRAALWNASDAVLMRSDMLAGLKGAELEAIAGYVLAGGTLAVAITRPEDLESPTLEALAGGPIRRAAVSSVTLRELAPPSVASTGSSSTAKQIPPAKTANGAVSETLAGFTGGNLEGSPYGSSAFYGLGEVHLLAFDPTRKPAVDDPWVQLRLVDLARRAFDRRATTVFRPGEGEASSPDYDGVRQHLDPNQSSRWAIGVAALLLCVYAILAGPVSFSMAARKGKPLRALLHLPLYAAATFAIILGIGISAKGTSGRARHLTLVEAGAGMSKGVARRWRGFFAARSKELTVRTTDASSVISTAILAETAEQKEHLVVERDAIRLVDVAALPWQTVVVREDGFASLGQGIAVVKDAAGEITVVNRTGRSLRAIAVRLPDGTLVYTPRLADGDKMNASHATKVASITQGAGWQAAVNAAYTRAGSMTVHALGAGHMTPIVDDDAAGLAAAWGALEQAAGANVDWFPAGVPVLIAQIDGGEDRAGPAVDAGLRLEKDRLLVRVVGYGGEP